MKTEYLGLTIDLARDQKFDQISLSRLKDSYFMEGETSPQHRYAYVSNKFGSNLEHSQRLYEYASKHWLGYSTPILSYGRNRNGLPISCFVGDTPVTTDNGMKLIKDLVVGDKVLSHDGTFNSVECIQKSDPETLYELDFQGEILRVTGDHLILTQENGWVRVDTLDSDIHTIVQIQVRP